MPRATKGGAKQAGRKSPPGGRASASDLDTKPATATSRAAGKKAGAAAKKPAASKRVAAAKKPAASSGAKAAKAAKPSSPAPKAKPVVDKFLHGQKALLEDERATYEAQAAALKAEADELAQEMEPGDIQFDEESGEGGTGNVDRERDLALSAQARGAVDEINHALQKIADGTYGVCEKCGQPIPRPRLKALPHARLCVACKSGGLSRR